MKKLVLLSAMAISGLFYNTAKAQFSVHVGVNLFPHRVLVVPRVDVDAPVYADANYSNNDDYYYLPDVNAYYNVDEQCYYYFDGNNWIAANYLPGEYHDFDWTTARRYEIRTPRPYLHNDVYFNRFRGNGDIAFNRDHFRGGFDGGFNRYRDRGPQQFADNNRGRQFGDRRDDHFNDHGQNGFDHNNDWNNDRGGQQAPNRWNNNRGQQQDQNRDWGGNGGQQNNQSNENHGWGNNGGQQGSQPSQKGNNGGQQNDKGGNGGQYAPAQNHNDGNRGGQQRIAANNNGFGGHNAGGHF